MNTEIILDTAYQELCKLLKLEKAEVYHFKQHWSGEFVKQFGTVETQWDRIHPFGKNLVWEDTHLQPKAGANVIIKV
ncbi:MULTISPECIES: hypothetical protein [unclassified Nostoc]|uniref:hypothetical protein n=1 Tax=unclassified Nostoc TaxID=2593658 RepID=UPI001CB92854|nr:hypothetical protein [Nostoc sp. 'Peltigera membranacea cyanobiont' 213]